MSQRNWKFHDYGMSFDRHIKVNRDCFHYAVVYNLTNLPAGSQCLICGDGEQNSQWLRKTRNDNANGSIRYATYESLDEALAAGIAWARRKDEEAA